MKKKSFPGELLMLPYTTATAMSSSFLSLRFLFFLFHTNFSRLIVRRDSIPFLLDANVSIGDFLTAKFIRHWKLYFFLFLLFALPFSLCFTFRIFFLLFNLKIVDRSFVHWQKKRAERAREKTCKKLLISLYWKRYFIMLFVEFIVRRCKMACRGSEQHWDCCAYRLKEPTIPNRWLSKMKNEKLNKRSRFCCCLPFPKSDVKRMELLFISMQSKIFQYFSLSPFIQRRNNPLNEEKMHRKCGLWRYRRKKRKQKKSSTGTKDILPLFLSFSIPALRA